MLIKLIYFFTIALAILFIAGFLSPFWWGFDILGNFVFQYLIVFAVATLIFFFTKQHDKALVSAIFVVIALFMVLPYHLPTRAMKPTPTVSAQDGSLRVMFFNAWILNDKYDEIANYIEEEDPDIIIMTEVADPAFPELEKRLTEYPHTRYHEAAYNYLDIAVFSKKPLSGVDIVTHGIGDTPSLVARLLVGSQPVTIVGVHTTAPISDVAAAYRDTQLAELAQYIAKMEGPLVVVGDFNATPWSHSFKKFVEDTNLKDTRIGYGLELSWPAFLPSFMRIPIDHSLVSKDIRVTDRQVGASLGSDHFSIMLDIEL